MFSKKTIFNILYLFLIGGFLFVGGNSIIFVPTKSGKVIDGLTKQPLKDIVITRYITRGGGGDLDPRVILAVETTKTNELGEFLFDQFVGLRLPFQYNNILFNFNIDPSINPYMPTGNPLNPTSCLGGGFENNKYFGVGYDTGMAGFYRSTEDMDISLVSLIPIIQDKKECEANALCLEENERWESKCEGIIDLCACRSVHTARSASKSEAQNSLIDQRLIRVAKESMYRLLQNCKKIGPVGQKIQCIRDAIDNILAETGDVSVCEEYTPSLEEFYGKPFNDSGCIFSSGYVEVYQYECYASAARLNKDVTLCKEINGNNSYNLAKSCYYDVCSMVAEQTARRSCFAPICERIKAQDGLNPMYVSPEWYTACGFR